MNVYHLLTLHLLHTYIYTHMHGANKHLNASFEAISFFCHLYSFYSQYMSLFIRVLVFICLISRILK